MAAHRYPYLYRGKRPDPHSVQLSMCSSEPPSTELVAQKFSRALRSSMGNPDGVLKPDLVSGRQYLIAHLGVLAYANRGVVAPEGIDHGAIDRQSVSTCRGAFYFLGRVAGESVAVGHEPGCHRPRCQPAVIDNRARDRDVPLAMRLSVAADPAGQRQAVCRQKTNHLSGGVLDSAISGTSRHESLRYLDDNEARVSRSHQRSTGLGTGGDDKHLHSGLCLLDHGLDGVQDRCLISISEDHCGERRFSFSGHPPV